MKNVILGLAIVLFSAQAFSGTALVLNAKETTLSVLYPAADSADPADTPTFDVGICDGHFEACLKLYYLGKGDEGNLYGTVGNTCLVSIKRIESNRTYTEIVKAVSGRENCKVRNGSQMQDIDGHYFL